MTRAFQSQADMADWLASAGIDTAAWGRGETKRFVDLWAEYHSGEAVFTNDPPARLLEVVLLFIRRGDAVLIELEQEFEDGRRRARLWPPSEKMRPGESPRDAARRCLREELGLGDGDATVSEEQRFIEETADSPSYPGLLTRYRFHVFEATAVLPDEDFYRDNHALDDPIRRHYWGWREEKVNPQIAQISGQ